MNLSRLPSLWSWPARFNPLLVSRRAWQIERWWWQQAHLELERVLRLAQEREQAVAPAWPQLADVAAQALLRLGAYGAAGECRVARKRKRAAVSRLLPVALADLPIPSWDMLPGETWEDYKLRVFTPLHDALFGIPEAFIQQYTASRLPLVRDASEQLRRRVQEVIAGAQRTWFTDRELAEQLQSAGRWPLARVKTQIRTETSNLYNAGRYAYMEGDDAVVGYKYVVTLDGRTTDLCRAIVGKYVRREELTAVPPLHYQCRTVLAPVFAWETGFAWSHGLPTPGQSPYQGSAYQGFGQPELITEVRGGLTTRIQPLPELPIPWIKLDYRLKSTFSALCDAVEKEFEWYIPSGRPDYDCTEETTEDLASRGRDGEASYTTHSARVAVDLDSSQGLHTVTHEVLHFTRADTETVWALSAIPYDVNPVLNPREGLNEWRTLRFLRRAGTPSEEVLALSLNSYGYSAETWGRLAYLASHGDSQRAIELVDALAHNQDRHTFWDPLDESLREHEEIFRRVLSAHGVALPKRWDWSKRKLRYWAYTQMAANIDRMNEFCQELVGPEIPDDVIWLKPKPPAVPGFEKLTKSGSDILWEALQ